MLVISGQWWVKTVMNIIKHVTNVKEQVTYWPKTWPNYIGNKLKTSKKWKLQGSWNGTIVLQEDYKGCMLQMLQSQNYGL
jgi:hypothetical protein